MQKKIDAARKAWYLESMSLVEKLLSLGKARNPVGRDKAAATVVIPFGADMNFSPALPSAARKNYVDVGDAPLKTYSEIEQMVQVAEGVDSVVSNLGALAGGASRFVSPSSGIAPVLSGVRTLGSRLAPVQAGLWAADSVRATASPEYRKEALGAFDERMADYETSTVSKSFNTAINVFARPVSTGGAMIRSSMAEMNRQAELEAKGVRLDAKNYRQRELNKSKARGKTMQDMLDDLEKKGKLGNSNLNNQLASMGEDIGTTYDPEGRGYDFDPEGELWGSSPDNFDPEGDGYDYISARAAGITPDKTGHWSSRDPSTGMLLKGAGHKTWSKTLKGEEEAGYEVYKNPNNGRYYSRKKK